MNGEIILMINKTISLLIVSFFLTSALIPISTLSESTDQQKKTLLFSELVDQVEQEKLKTYHNGLMSFGPRYTGSKNCSDAGDWLYSTFSSMGHQVEFHNWEYAGFSSRNIVVTIPGTKESSSIEYLLTAHYDCTSNSLGADDDGSGIAAILTIADLLRNQNFSYTIRIIAFSGEEVGTFGSFCYARDAYRRGDNIRAVINPDMIGFADTKQGGKTLRFFYPERSKWIATFAQNVSNNYDIIIDMTVDALPNYIGADHQPFVDYGYDGVWVAHQDGYEWANTPEDNPEHLNFTYLTKATKLLLAIIAELAVADVPVNVRLTQPFEGCAYLMDKPIIRLDLGKQWYWGLRAMTLLLGRTRAQAVVESNYDIEYVIFCVDNNFIYWDSTPPYEWNIQGKHSPLIGKHNLQVYAYTTNDLVATDQMDIYSILLKCQYN